MEKLSLTTIYKFGIYSFIIIGLANSWGFVLKVMAGVPAWALIVALGGIALNIMFATLFWYLAYKMPQPQELPEDMKGDEDLKELFKNG